MKSCLALSWQLSTLLLSLGGVAKAAPAVPVPPAGTYSCVMWSLGAPIYGSGMTYSLQVNPSVLGRVILDGKGTYKLDNSRGGSGKYSYNAAKSTFVFNSGPMQAFGIRYEYSDDGFKEQRFALQLIDQKTGKKQNTSCSFRTKSSGRPLSNVSAATNSGSGLPAARAGDPNPGLKGTLIFSQGGTIISLDLASGKRQNRLTGQDLTSNKAGELLYFQQGRLNFADKTLKFTGGFALDAADDSVEYLALSPDGQRVAYARTGWPPSVMVRQRNGQVLKQIEEGDNPNFLPDGRLLLSQSLGLEGAVPAIWIMSADLNTRQTLPLKLDDLSGVALSPDGKRLAFISHGDIFTANIDGSGIKQRTNTDDLEQHLSWSPDAQSLVYTLSSYKTLYILGPNDKQGRQIRDETGEIMTAQGNVVWK